MPRNLQFCNKSTGEVETYRFSGKGLQERIQRVYSPGNKGIKAVSGNSGQAWVGGPDYNYITFEDERGAVSVYTLDQNLKLKLEARYP